MTDPIADPITGPMPDPMPDPVADPRAGARPRLFALAYRMLGSTHDAEDAVAETFLRWERLPEGERARIEVPLAWLTRVVSRVCLDQLGTARARRERYQGLWLPEPVPGTVAPGGVAPAPPADPADVVTLEESVSVALLVVMESMTPAERVSFVLHDVFGVSYAEIADVVGRTAGACRQLASSGRARARAGRRLAVQGPERDRVVAAFAAACGSGDLTRLAAVLDPEVVLRADGGGIVTSARRPVLGADHVGRFLLGVLARGAADDARCGEVTTVRPVLANGQTALLAVRSGAPTAVVTLGVRGERVVTIELVVSPEKLTPWTAIAAATELS